MGNFEKEHLDIIKNLYEKEPRQGLNGKDAKNIYDRLRKDEGDVEKKSMLLLGDYEKSVGETLPKMLDCQSMLFEEFVKDITIDSTIITKDSERR